ncbi:MAG: exo-alpha-sialidase [Ruminococcaceae bacterium]|nr:exo-alpha-sialidase [Oscillospiraceae bacterium]
MSVLFKKGDNGYHTFRIPSLFCTQKGVLLAFAEGRVVGSADMQITHLLMRKSYDGGKSWSDMEIMGANEGDCYSNPTPVQDLDTGRSFFFYVMATAEAIAGWQWPMPMPAKTIFYKYSDDDGETWSDPVDVTAQITPAIAEWDSPGPANGLQITMGKYKGRLVIPVNGHVIYSDDHGETWIRGSFSEEIARNETTVAELFDGTLLMNTRCDLKGKRIIVKSDNGGETWGEIGYHDILPETSCQASQISCVVGDRHCLIFAAPTEGYRRNLYVKASFDDGKSYSDGKLVCEGFAAYSGVVLMPDNKVGVIYEHGSFQADDTDSSTQYEKISFDVLDVQDII